MLTAVRASIYDAYVRGVKAEYPEELEEAAEEFVEEKNMEEAEAFSCILLRDMEARMRQAGGIEEFVHLLDQYYGYMDAEDETSQDGKDVFSGFSEARDMTAPAAYYYAGKHDRMCQIIDLGMRYMFTEGRNGLPGDNHLGALSSLYVWYAMGLFPVSGQDKLIIGTPRMQTVAMHLANDNDFTVSREGEGIYVAEAFLNGQVLSDFSIKASDMMRGGTLRLVMKETVEER